MGRVYCLNLAAWGSPCPEGSRGPLEDLVAEARPRLGGAAEGGLGGCAQRRPAALALGFTGGIAESGINLPLFN